MGRTERAAVGLAAGLLLLSACGANTPPAPLHSVTLVAKSTQTEFWLSVFAGAEAAAAEYNLELTTVGPETEEDYETQNEMIARAVEAGTEALVFSAIDFEKNAPAVDAAAQAGVRIVSIDSGVDSSQVSTYIGTDNYAAGQMAAQAALEQVEGPLSVGLVNYDEGTANGQERERGVLDARPDELLDVPGFEGILIHRGNTAEDTAGCILVGENKEPGKVVNSGRHEEELTRTLKEAQANGEEIWLEIEQ